MEKFHTQKIKGATINRHNRTQTRFTDQLRVNLPRIRAGRKMKMQLTGQAQDDLRARKGTCRCCALSAKVGRMVLTFAMVFSEPLSSGRLRSFLGIRPRHRRSRRVQPQRLQPLH